MEAFPLPEIQFGRTVHFRASHFYRLPEKSEAENRARFGPVAEPHEHDYHVTVWLAGPLHAPEMMAVDLVQVDAVLQRAIVEKFNGQCLNEADPFFAHHLPTNEALCAYLAERLAPALHPAHLRKIRVAEHPDLFAEWQS